MGANRRGDLGGELGDLGDDRLEAPRPGRAPTPRRASASSAPARALGRRAQPLQQLGGRAPAAVAVAGEEALQALLAEPSRVGRASGSAPGRRARSGESTSAKIRAAPGQKASSWARSSLASSHPAPRPGPRGCGSAPAAPWSRRSRAQAPGSDGRRCAPARPGRRHRSRRTCRRRPRSAARVAFSSLGWIGKTVKPASSRRSTRRPSGRSIATRPTPQGPHPGDQRPDPGLVVGDRARPRVSLPPRRPTQSACSSLAQSIPATRSCHRFLLGRFAFGLSRPGGTVAVAHSGGASGRHFLWPLQVPPTAGRRWSHAGPLRGKRRGRSPDGGRLLYAFPRDLRRPRCARPLSNLRRTRGRFSYEHPAEQGHHLHRPGDHRPRGGQPDPRVPRLRLQGRRRRHPRPQGPRGPRRAGLRHRRPGGRAPRRPDRRLRRHRPPRLHQGRRASRRS